MEYEQLIPWVKPVEVDNDGNWSVSDKGFRVILGDYVTTEDGTGIVHIAPTFGADDAFVARAAGIPSLFMINKRGETRPMVDLTGKFYLLDEPGRKIRKRVCRCRRLQRIPGTLGEECLRPAIHRQR